MTKREEEAYKKACKRLRELSKRDQELRAWERRVLQGAKSV